MELVAWTVPGETLAVFFATVAAPRPPVYARRVRRVSVGDISG